MNCITDFLPDDTSEHNIDGESIEEIVFGIQPAPETLTPSELDAAIYGTPEYWRQMSNASVEAHAVTLERVKALEDENTRLRAVLENIAHCPVSSGEYGYMVMLYEARRALGIPTPYDNLTDDDIGEDGL